MKYSVEEMRGQRKLISPSRMEEINQDSKNYIGGFLYLNQFFIGITPSGYFECEVMRDGILSEDLNEVEQFLFDEMGIEDHSE